MDLWRAARNCYRLAENGNGTFKPQTPTFVGSSLMGGAIGDINADGKLDLILSNYTDTYVLAGNGDGTFQSPIMVQQGGVDTALDSAVGDFNNDGKLDLILAPSEYLLQEVALASSSPASLDFPAQRVGTKSAAQVVTLSNSGSGTLTITSIGITGGNASDFGQTNTCSSTLAISASCLISVTIAPTAGGGRSSTLTISSNGVGGPQTIALTGTGNDFSLTTESSTTATISPGQTASYGLMANPQGAFSQTVALSCNGAPPQSNCLVLPSSLVLSGSLTATVTVTTTAPSTVGLMSPSGAPPQGSASGSKAALLSTLGLAMLAGLVGLRRHLDRRPVPYGFALLLLLSIGSTMSGCGGGNSVKSGGSGTPAGSYTLTVIASSSGSSTLTHAIKFALVVK